MPICIVSFIRRAASCVATEMVRERRITRLLQAGYANVGRLDKVYGETEIDRSNCEHAVLQETL